MLNDADASGFKKVYLAMGFTDLRRGIDGLATIVRFQFKLDPYDKNTRFLFCGRRCDRIKALLWEGDGFLLDADGISADMLRNSAGFALLHLRLPNRIQQRGFAVVNMAHNTYNR